MIFVFVLVFFSKKNHSEIKKKYCISRFEKILDSIKSTQDAIINDFFDNNEQIIKNIILSKAFDYIGKNSDDNDDSIADVVRFLLNNLKLNNIHYSRDKITFDFTESEAFSLKREQLNIELSTIYSHRQSINDIN